MALSRAIRICRDAESWRSHETILHHGSSVITRTSLRRKAANERRMMGAAPTTWTLLGNVTLTNSPQDYVDFSSKGQPKRFYRAVPQ